MLLDVPETNATDSFVSLHIALVHHTGALCHALTASMYMQGTNVLVFVDLAEACKHRLHGEEQQQTRRILHEAILVAPTIAD